MQNNEQAVYDAIVGHFSCDRRRVKFIAYLMVALLKLTNASLADWCLAINQPTQRSSRYKRLQRFMSQFRFSAQLYAQIVWQRYGQGREVVLTLDRTEYQQGQQWIQLLVLGIAHQGMSVPLLWHSANRQGNSPLIARKLLLRLFTNWIQPTDKQTVYITADREFIGSEFRSCALIPVIRIRANAQVMTPQGKRQRVATLFDCPQWRLLRKPRRLYKEDLYLAGKRLADGDFLIIYSRIYLSHIGRLYGQRWGIETLFGAYKSRGFCLEQCRMQHHHRLRTLLFVLSMGLIWAIETGLWLIKKGVAIPCRVVETVSRRVYSLFRHGLDELRDRCLNHRAIQDLIPLLSCL